MDDCNKVIVKTLIFLSIENRLCNALFFSELGNFI